MGKSDCSAQVWSPFWWRSQEQKCLAALKLIRLHLMKSWTDTRVADPWSQAASPALSPAFLQVWGAHSHAHLRLFSVLLFVDMQNHTQILNYCSNTTWIICITYLQNVKIRGGLTWAFLVMARATPLWAVVSASSMEKHLGAASENIIWEYFNKKNHSERKLNI